MAKQMRINSIVSVYLLESLLILLLLSGCDEIFRNPYTREISPGVELSQEWTEFELSPPLEAINMIQSIDIEFENMISWDISPGKGTIKTPDGIPIEIDVHIIATDGTIYDMDSIAWGRAIMFTHYPKNAKLLDTKTTLPKSKNYTKVKIRASRPIQTGKISWVCVTNH